MQSRSDMKGWDSQTCTEHKEGMRVQDLKLRSVLPALCYVSAPTPAFHPAARSLLEFNELWGRLWAHRRCVCMFVHLITSESSAWFHQKLNLNRHECWRSSAGRFWITTGAQILGALPETLWKVKMKLHTTWIMTESWLRQEHSSQWCFVFLWLFGGISVFSSLDQLMSSDRVIFLTNPHQNFTNQHLKLWFSA